MTSPVPAIGSGEKRIAVDWDGTCVVGAWPAMGDWLPGAKTALRSMLNSGYEVVIHSTRLAPTEIDERTPRSPDIDLRTIRAMLDEAGLEQVLIWTNPWKPGAAVYIDDKAVRFNGDWMEVLGELTRTVPTRRLRLIMGGKR